MMHVFSLWLYNATKLNAEVVFLHNGCYEISDQKCKVFNL
jgi:hypothetical protein